jgi:hypothetical protein
MLTITEMASAFCLQYGLTVPTARWKQMHDAVHYLGQLGVDSEGEYLVTSVYQPIMWGGDADQVLDEVGEKYLSHIYKAMLLKKEYGHLFI